jgi:hypothetical protein
MTDTRPVRFSGSEITIDDRGLDKPGGTVLVRNDFLTLIQGHEPRAPQVEEEDAPLRSLEEEPEKRSRRRGPTTRQSRSCRTSGATTIETARSRQIGLRSSREKLPRAERPRAGSRRTAMRKARCGPSTSPTSPSPASRRLR